MLAQKHAQLQNNHNRYVHMRIRRAKCSFFVMSAVTNNKSKYIHLFYRLKLKIWLIFTCWLDKKKKLLILALFYLLKYLFGQLILIFFYMNKKTQTHIFFCQTTSVMMILDNGRAKEDLNLILHIAKNRERKILPSNAKFPK